MRIIHISSFDYLKRSGIGEVVISLSKNQRLLGHEVFILQIHKSFCKMQQANIYFISNYRDYIRYICKIKPDIVIFHSVYKWEYILFSHFLKLQHIPYLIEPHGGSTYENLNKSYYKKKVANLLFFKKKCKRCCWNCIFK